MEMDNAENPVIMENLVKALGAEPVVYAMRNECCGGYITMEDKALAAKKSSKVLENASSNGAECLITACPLCLYNLNKNGKIASGKELPVYYLTTLLAAALGNADAVKALENASKADCGCCCNGGK
jgi:heterodisulfide reductase subunit B